MGDERLPIKFFAQREVDELRTEPGGNSTPPKWLLTGSELEERASQLVKDFDKFEIAVKSKIDTDSIIPFIFTAKIDKDSTAKTRRKNISDLFQISSKNNVIGVSRSNNLIVRIDSLAEMKVFSSRLRDYDKNNSAISCLEGFEQYEPIIVECDEVQSYKVKLVDFQDFEQNVAIQRLFEKLLKNKGIESRKTNYSDQLVVYNLKNVGKATLDGLKDSEASDALLSIEPMPKYVVSLDYLESVNPVDVIHPKDDCEYVAVGILDSGIAHIPHLAPWIADDRWTVYPENDLDLSHGTFVAGIASYGDLCEGKKWVDHKGVKLFDAAVFPSNPIDEDELIANIQEAVIANHQDVKIWNLSGSVEEPVNDDRFSDLAIALDSLQDSFNILMCKSAGNCYNFMSGRPKGRIHGGADSIRSLVVGSIAHEKNGNDMAEVNNPSPFSRVGPGPEFIIKPEITHYGGNAGVDDAGKLTYTGVSSFSPVGNLIAYSGTSFSTPRVASLAAGLCGELDEEFDPLLLKSLIIHSASYPEDLKIPPHERTKQLGFGVPKTINEIIYNSPFEATLILRDNLAKGDFIEILDFPMPTCLIKDGYFTGQIIATLVYDPILDSSQGNEYCQSNIDIKFGSYDEKTERDTDKRNILNPVGKKDPQNLLLGSVYSKKKIKRYGDIFALRERLLIEYGDKYYPVKKYAVNLEDVVDSKKLSHLKEDSQWYLRLTGVYRDHIERKAAINSSSLSQEFCLIITIRDSTGMGNVYDEVSQKLDEFNFWHSNIKLSSDVSVSV